MCLPFHFLEKLMMKLIRPCLAQSSSTIVLTLALMEPAFAQLNSTLQQQMDQLQYAVCIQDWSTALRWVNQIIGSEALPNGDRSFYVTYRRTLENYQSSQTRFETTGDCNPPAGENLTAIALDPNSSVLPNPDHSNANFDWDAAIQQVSQGVTAPRFSTPSPPPEVTPETKEPPEEVSLDASQGVFMRPVPSSNIPAQSILGSLINTLPIPVETVRVYYQVYSQRPSDGPNPSPIYTCQFTQRDMPVVDRLEPGNQARVSIAETNSWVQVVGITWKENGNHAFVRVSEIESSSNVRPCSPWSNYGRQAVDPQIRLQ